jgi:hypothetical protein
MNFDLNLLTKHDILNNKNMKLRKINNFKQICKILGSNNLTVLIFR